MLSDLFDFIRLKDLLEILHQVENVYENFRSKFHIKPRQFFFFGISSYDKLVLRTIYIMNS